MRNIKTFLIIFLSILIVFSPAWAKQTKVKSSWISARSYVVMDFDDGKVLYAKRPYLRLPAASTVKVMTAIVVMENSYLNKPVVVSRKAAYTEPSKAYLGEGATYSTYDLLQALLISSANDAAVALAESVSGSEENFVKLMNAKAKELGMAHTRFINASGLPGRRQQHYTTAYDLAILMRYASRNKTFDRILSMRASAIKGSDGRRLYLTNHNKLLKTHPNFVVGKTGYTLSAKHCFLGSDKSCPKNIVFSILYSRNPWQDIKRLASYGLRLENRRK